MTHPITITAPGPGTPVGILWPKRATAGVPVVADGRPTQVADWGGMYWAVRFRAGDGDVVELVPGTPVEGQGTPLSEIAELARPFIAAHSVDLLSTISNVEVMESGPLYQSAMAIGPRGSLLVEWYPDLAAGVVRLVLRNGVVDPQGMWRVQDRDGRLVVMHGARVLHNEHSARHHFGRMVSYRYAITRGAVSMQTEPWPMAHVRLPLDLYALHALLPGYHASVGEPQDAPDVTWGMDLGDSIFWPQGGSSGGGKPTLAPLPRHDVLALHDPETHLANALWAADRFPYPYFFTDSTGDWIRPQTHPSGWCDLNKTGYHDGRTFRDFGPDVAFGSLEPSPYRADCSHLPQAFLVPAILTADPFYRWAAEGYAFGASMQTRGIAGGWTDRQGRPLTPVSENVKNSRGPTGASAWVGRQERAWGWTMNQRLDAALLGGHPDIMGMLRSALTIARGHYLDQEAHTFDPERWWGHHCAPWWWEAVHKDGHGRPQQAFLSEGDAAYVRPQNAIRADRCTDARASWQDAFIARPIMRASEVFGGVPGLEWLDVLAAYAETGHIRMMRADLPVSAYCWPTRDADGWMSTDRVREAFYLSDATDVPSGGRTLHLDANGLEQHNGYAYVAYNMPVMAANPEWQGKIAEVIESLPLEWRLTL